mmetsp:Transcript_35878/g.69338  ORF Transcript_35878/g.69338 Transcript_35878/m.69338 type:complete len:239 (-) Transcript_35878:546-1262(-)
MVFSRWSSFACRNNRRPSFVPCGDLRSISSSPPPHSRCCSPKTERKLSRNVCFSSCLSQVRGGDSPAASARAGLTEMSVGSCPLPSLDRSRSTYLRLSRSCISAATRNLSPANTAPAPPLPRKRPAPPLKYVLGRISAPSAWSRASPFSLTLVFLGAVCFSRKQVGHVYWTMIFTRPPLKYGGNTANNSPAVFFNHIFRRKPSTFRASSVFARHILQASMSAARANRTELRSSGLLVR